MCQGLKIIYEEFLCDDPADGSVTFEHRVDTLHIVAVRSKSETLERIRATLHCPFCGDRLYVREYRHAHDQDLSRLGPPWPPMLDPSPIARGGR